jgi:hypothetical protein
VVREHAPARPLVSEHRAQDLLLRLVVAADGVRDPGDRVDRHVAELDEAAVVVRVRVRDEHAGERLARLLHAGPQAPTAGDRQRAVHDDDAVVAFDHVRVHRHRLGATREAVDGCHAGV